MDVFKYKSYNEINIDSSSFAMTTVVEKNESISLIEETAKTKEDVVDATIYFYFFDLMTGMMRKISKTIKCTHIEICKTKSPCDTFM